MNEFTFDLWRDPWIRVQDATSRTALLGLGETLRNAHQWRALADPSPLVVVGVHRLLVAILQDALRPEKDADLAALWQSGRLPEEPLAAFERAYADRFDLFSEDQPFLQSADLGLAQEKGDNVKTVLYLHPDWPAGSEATHYRHGQDADVALCPACVAAGLVTQPAFATSGGSGIKPSINGVPPLYVLPQGATLAESLIASLITPPWQPEAADRDQDQVWWRHAPVVGFKDERQYVGYLHSLTFPARQVRLHPTPAQGQTCSRCGADPWQMVRTMVYNMGESRAGGADFWRDPFAAYKPRRSGKGEPVPLRPQKGRALWRDYAALFLDPARQENSTLRPRVLDQINTLADRGALPVEELPVRCVGIRTDMKAKIFEWVDQGLDVPLALLHSPEAAIEVEQGLDFGEKAESAIRFVWAKSFQSGSSGRYLTQRSRMLDQYWASLPADFGRYVIQCSQAAQADDRDQPLAAARQTWAEAVVSAAQRAFEQGAAQLGDDAVSLRQRVQGEAYCRALLIKGRKEFAPQ